jgi:hypothetical protein
MDSMAVWVSYRGLDCRLRGRKAKQPHQRHRKFELDRHGPERRRQRTQF